MLHFSSIIKVYHRNFQSYVKEKYRRYAFRQLSLLTTVAFRATWKENEDAKRPANCRSRQS